MYSTLSLQRLVTLLGLPPLAFFLLLAAFSHLPQNLGEAWSLAKSVVGWWGLFLVLFGSGSKWWAPWRLVWAIPGVQRFVFPDLNGVWEGTTNSNWPSIEAMLDTYEKREKPGHAGSLDQIPLRIDKIELTIRASFFRFRIDGKLSSTGGTSHSISARVAWNDSRERYELCYLYLQSTPNPTKTDESSHLGAASLALDMEAVTLKGEYMNRRNWRQGLNAAGILEVTRIRR